MAPSLSVLAFFGIRQIKLTSLSDSTEYLLPAAQELSCAVMSSSGRVEGNDAIQAIMTFATHIEVSFTDGKYSFQALSILTGSSVATAGASPTRTDTLVISAGQCYPYFKVEGRVISDDCSQDMKVTIHKCKVESGPSQAFTMNQFITPQYQAIGVADDSDQLITLVQEETGSALTAT
jgi:hypothetical protein